MLVVESVAQGSATDATDLAWTHTPITGIRRLMVVGVEWRETIFSASGIGPIEVSRDATLFTFHALVSSGGVNNEIWYLANPPIGGAGNMSVVFTGAGIGEGGAGSLIAGSVHFTGVYLANPIGTAASATGSSTTPSVAITGNDASNLILDSMAASYAGAIGARTVGAGQTQRWDDQNTSFPLGLKASGSGSTEQSTEGSVTMDWTLANTGTWTVLAVEIFAGRMGIIPMRGVIPVLR